MTNVNQAPLPRLSKAPLVRASLVKRRYIKYLALPFFYLWKLHIWNRRPHFAYSLYNFYGATMTIKGRLLLSVPIVKRFRLKIF